jgi:hypothetical protein
MQSAESPAKTLDEGWDQDDVDKARRCEQLRRCLLLIDELARRRTETSIRDLNRSLNERTGDTWCERTTGRDLRILCDLGLADATRSFGRGSVHLFKIRPLGFERLIRLIAREAA